MNNLNIQKLVRRALLNEATQDDQVNAIIKKLVKSSSEGWYTFGGGTDEELAKQAIKDIPNLEIAKKVDEKYGLRNFIDGEFNFKKSDDRDDVIEIFHHLESLGVKIINPDDQKTFDLDFSGSGVEQGGEGTKPIVNPEKEQDTIINKGGCKPAPSLDSLCTGKSYLKNCMKGDSVIAIQNFLISKGLTKVSKTGKADGVYGPLTKSMVIKFQTSAGLKPDGIAGPQTISAMGICSKKDEVTPTPGSLSSTTQTDASSTVTNVINPQKSSDIVNPDKEDVVETLCEITDKSVIKAYNTIRENMSADDPTFLRRECRIVINYQIDNEKHCDNLQTVICFCGTKASSGEDGYAFMGEKKKYLKTYVSSYCKTDFTQDETQPVVLDQGKPGVVTEGCRTPGSVISILQQEDDDLSKDDCKILFSEAVNWYNSWKKCERKEHSANPAYKAKCFACLNKYNFNWKDLGSGENKVVRMYGFNKREINKKQRRELPRMESVEALNRALLMMNYDMNKTLTENREIIENNDKTRKRI